MTVDERYSGVARDSKLSDMRFSIAMKVYSQSIYCIGVSPPSPLSNSGGVIHLHTNPFITPFNLNIILPLLPRGILHKRSDNGTSDGISGFSKNQSTDHRHSINNEPLSKHVPLTIIPSASTQRPSTSV
jgi:hypothetical protein